MKTNEAIELFKLGDRIGAPYESGCLNISFKRIPIEEIRLGYQRSGRGTDESDTVDCFLRFTEGYHHFESPEKFIMDWFVFHSKHRAASGYGRTYKDHFRTVLTLNAKGKLTLSELLVISEDRNSYGNGCLFLVYPLYRYFTELGMAPEEKAMWVCEIGRLSHAHPIAVDAVRLLHDIVDRRDLLASCRPPYIEEFLTTNIDLLPDDFMKVYPDNVRAPHTLFYALYCVRHAESLNEVAVKVIGFGGDTDSVCALAFMIYNLLKD